MMITGPNDARRIVWALGEFFYYFLCVFFWYLTIYIGTTDSLKVWCGSTQATTTTTGTKTRHLGLGECFLLLFIVFIILITIVNRFWNDGTQMTVTLLFGPRYHHHTTTPYQHHTIPTPHHTNNTSSSSCSWDTKPPAQTKISRRGWGIEIGTSQSLNGMCFFFLIFFDYSNFYLHLQLQLWNQHQHQHQHTPAPTACDDDDNNEDKWPRWCISRRLGNSWVFFLLVVIF